MSVLQGHEQGVVLQPVRLLGAEGGKLGPVLGQKAVAGPVEHRVAGLIHQPVVHILGVLPPVEGLKLRRLQQALLRQGVQVDEVGVAGEGGEGLIGGVAVAGGARREQLPAALAAGGQKVRKFPGLLSQRPDAVGGGQGEDGH